MDRMFMNIEMAEVVRQCEGAAEKMVAQFTEPQLLANSLEELVDAVVTEKVPRAIALDAGHHRIGTQVVPTPRGQIFGVPHPQRGGQDPAESVKVSLHIPWSGTRQAFTFRPHHSLQINPEGTVTERDVILSVVVYPGTPGDIAQKYVLDQEHNLLQWVDRVNGDIAQLEHQIRGMVRSRIAERRDILRQRDAMATAFTIPIRQAEPDRALQIPVRRATIVLRGSSPAGTGGQPEWSITDAVYEQMIRTITSFSHALERRPASAAKLLPDEETLRDWLMFVLGTNYEAPDGGEIFIGGETVNGKGKTDILIRHQTRNAFIAECKFWDGPSKLDEAIEQLLGYTVWRDTKAAIILFVTRRNATAAIDRAGGRLASHAACLQAAVSTDPYRRRDYRFISPQDEQRIISLALLPVVVPAGLYLRGDAARVRRNHKAASADTTRQRATRTDRVA